MKLFVSLVLCGIMALPAIGADIDEDSAEAIGAWQLDFTTPEGESKTPIVIVGRQRENLVAWYVGDDEPQDFSEVELDGEELRLTFRPAKFDGNILVTFVGHLTESGACEGDIEYETTSGDSGSFDFSGKRIKPSQFDFSTVWEISFETPDGEEHEAQVMAVGNNDKVYGWYSSDDYELPAKEMSKDGDEVVMSLSVKTEEGDTVEVTFRGTVDGDSISGDAEYDFQGQTGSFPFTGKRES